MTPGCGAGAGAIAGPVVGLSQFAGGAFAGSRRGHGSKRLKRSVAGRDERSCAFPPELKR